MAQNLQFNGTPNLFNIPQVQQGMVMQQMQGQNNFPSLNRMSNEQALVDSIQTVPLMQLSQMTRNMGPTQPQSSIVNKPYFPAPALQRPQILQEAVKIENNEQVTSVNNLQPQVNLARDSDVPRNYTRPQDLPIYSTPENTSQLHP